MISKRKFNEIISRKRGYDELIGKLYDLGVDVRTEKDEFDAIGAFFDEILAENFDDTGVELVYWWMYDNVEKFIYESDSCNVIADLTEVDALYDYLVKNHAVRNDEWQLCTEENYPENDDCYKYVVKVKDEDGYEYYIYAKCPFGWNVLMRREAMCKKID